MSIILQRDGLTIELLEKLSYKSEMGINLKKNLHYFEREVIVADLLSMVSMNHIILLIQKRNLHTQLKQCKKDRG